MVNYIFIEPRRLQPDSLGHIEDGIRLLVTALHEDDYASQYTVKLNTDFPFFQYK